MPRRNMFVIGALAGLSGAVIGTAQPQLVNLGVLPGRTSSEGNAINFAGTKVAGTSDLNYGFIWSVEDGMSEMVMNLGSPYGTPIRPTGMTSSGSTVVGSMRRSSWTRAFRYSSSNGFSDFLGTLFQTSPTYAMDISDDGRFILCSAGQTPFVWDTQNPGYQPIPGPSNWGGTGEAISGDGSIVVGRAQSPQRAFRYESSTGVVFLDVLPGTVTSRAQDISADGTTIVGSCEPSNGFPGEPDIIAFRWTQDSGMVDLGAIPAGYRGSHAETVSADGSAIGGYFSNPNGSARAMYWTESLGMVDLNDYLPSAGVDLDGWTLRFVYAISGDGTAVTGFGNLEGQPGGAFLITGLPGNTPPCPADLTGDNTVNLADLNLVLANFGTTTPDGDTNNDGVVDLADLNAVLAAFGQLCP